MKGKRKTIRKILSLILCLTFFSSYFSITTFALEEYTYGDYTYTVSGGEATITSYPETAKGEVTIPSEIDGKKVVSIAQYSFYACTLITKIAIPNTVKTIDKYAFAYCTTLEQVFISKSVIEIKDSAFEHSSSISEICYEGSKEQWSKITIGKNNSSINTVDKKYEIDLAAFVSGISEINQSDTVFNEKKYIADIWLNRHGAEKTSESVLVDDILSYYSPSSEMYNDLQSNKDFQNSVGLWNGMQVVFDPATGLDNLIISKTDIYETLILDMLQKNMEAENKNIGNVVLDSVNAVSDSSKKITKYKKLIDNFNNSYTKLGKSFTVAKSDGSVFDILKGEEYKSISTKFTDAKFMQGLGSVLDVAENYTDFCKKLSAYVAATEMTDEMLAYLTEMKNHTNNQFLIDALTNVIKSANEADYAITICSLQLTADTEIDIAKFLIDEISKGSKVYYTLKLAYKAGVAFDNLVFNTSKTIDKYYLLKATKDFIDVSKDTINTLKQNYFSTQSEYDAGAYVYAVKTYNYAYCVDLESAKSFIEQASNEGLINYAKRGCVGLWNLLTGSNAKTSYKEFCDSKDTIEYLLNNLFLSLDTSWKYNESYLKTDYPDVYYVYLTKDLSKDEYKPKISECYISQSGKTVLNWSVPIMFYDKNGNCYPLYGSSVINGIKVTETVGSKTTEKVYDDNYLTAPNPLEFYNASLFSTFPKKYTLTAFSTTSNGNVSTKTDSVSLVNPLMQVELKLPNGLEMMKWKNCTSISIVDHTHSRYTNVKYNIYRKTDTTSWKLIKTIGRDFSLNGSSTVFTDDTTTIGENYTYKVSSYLVLDNGVKLFSTDSAPLSIKNAGKVASVTNVRTEASYKPEFPVTKGSRVKSASSTTDYSERSSQGIMLSWDSISTANKYEIYKISSYGELYKLIATVGIDNLTYFDENVENGVTYNYIVVPCTQGTNKTYDVSNYAQGEIKYNTANVNSVSLDGITMNYKSSATLTPSISADDGAEYTVSYSSSNGNVTVDDNGNIYGAKKGSAEITCTVTDSNGNTVSDTCTVTVKYSFFQWIIKILLFGWIWY